MQALSVRIVHRHLGRVRQRNVGGVHMLSHAFGCGGGQTGRLLGLFLRFSPSVYFRLRVRPTLLSRRLGRRLTGLPGNLLRLRTNVRDLHRPILRRDQQVKHLSSTLGKLGCLYTLPGVRARTSLVTKLPLCRLSRVFRSVQALTRCKTKRVRLRSLGLLPNARVQEETRRLKVRCTPLPPCRILRAERVDMSRLRATHCLSQLLSNFCGAPT